MNDQDYMVNSEGHHVPISKVKAEDKLENLLVSDLISMAEIHNASITSFKQHALEEVKEFISLLAEQYGAKKGGKGGNVTLTSYDGLHRVIVSVQKYIDFGAQLQVAKELVDECLQEWSEGANDNLRAFVEQAFRVDGNNRLNTSAILGLRRYNITEEKWLQAMKAIDDSIRVTSSKEYIRFYQRPSTEDDFEAVSIDIAKV